MGVKITNNASGTLSAAITSGATTLTLTSGQGALFPTLGAGDYCWCTLVDTSNNVEIIKVTARSTDTMTIVRGQDNTTAQAFAINDRLELRPTAALFAEFATTATTVTKTSATGSGVLPAGTTAQRDGSPSAGYLRWNTTDTSAEVYDGSAWAAVGGGNTTDEGLYEHSHTINTAYSITSTNNAMSAGPVTIGSSGSVTIPSTSVWTIV